MSLWGWAVSGWLYKALHRDAERRRHLGERHRREVVWGLPRSPAADAQLEADLRRIDEAHAANFDCAHRHGDACEGDCAD